MEIETLGRTDRKEIIFQSDFIKYHEAYTMNCFQVYEANSFVDVVSTIIESILVETDGLSGQTNTAFHGKDRPVISLRDYLLRIIKHCDCSSECIVLTLIYIDRLIENSKGFCINSLNIHRILLTAIMLGAKFFDDFYYSNDFYAKVGGISTKEINKLEIEFLNFIKFSLYVDPIIFFRYREQLISKSIAPIEN